MSSRGDMEKYDSLYLSVLQQEGSLPGLFDSLFGFLMRRTDFFHRLTDSAKGDRGFPEGAALTMVTQSFKKHETLARRSIQEQQRQQHQPQKSQTTAKQPQQPQQKQPPPPQPTATSTVIDKATGEIAYSADPECYNGATRDGYAWSQNIGELDIRVNVDPSVVVKGSDVRVRVSRRSLLVETRQGAVVLDRQLCHEVRAEEAVWSLVPSDSVVLVSLEKVQERWWDSCFVGEDKINTREIDCSRPMSDLDDEAQAKIGQMMFDQRQKQLGLPISEEVRSLDLLRKAWDAEGSPFKGTPFDPSVLSTGGRPADVGSDQSVASGKS